MTSCVALSDAFLLFSQNRKLITRNSPPVLLMRAQHTLFNSVYHVALLGGRYIHFIICFWLAGFGQVTKLNWMYSWWKVISNGERFFFANVLWARFCQNKCPTWCSTRRHKLNKVQYAQTIRPEYNWISGLKNSSNFPGGAVIQRRRLLGTRSLGQTLLCVRRWVAGTGERVRTAVSVRRSTVCVIQTRSSDLSTWNTQTQTLHSTYIFSAGSFLWQIRRRRRKN